MTIQERVQQGIALLDEHKPDWREQIWIDGLDMGSSSDGLLEQVCKMPYIKAIRALGLHISLGYDYGFDIGGDGNDPEEENKRQWRELTDAWKKAISFVSFHETE